MADVDLGRDAGRIMRKPRTLHSVSLPLATFFLFKLDARQAAWKAGKPAKRPNPGVRCLRGGSRKRLKAAAPDCSLAALPLPAIRRMIAKRRAPLWQARRPKRSGRNQHETARRHRRDVSLHGDAGDADACRWADALRAAGGFFRVVLRALQGRSSCTRIHLAPIFEKKLARTVLELDHPRLGRRRRARSRLPPAPRHAAGAGTWRAARGPGRRVCIRCRSTARDRSGNSPSSRAWTTAMSPSTRRCTMPPSTAAPAWRSPPRSTTCRRCRAR